MYCFWLLRPLKGMRDSSTEMEFEGIYTPEIKWFSSSTSGRTLCSLSWWGSYLGRFCCLSFTGIVSTSFLNLLLVICGFRQWQDGQWHLVQCCWLFSRCGKCCVVGVAGDGRCTIISQLTPAYCSLLSILTWLEVSDDGCSIMLYQHPINFSRVHFSPSFISSGPDPDLGGLWRRT